MFDFLQKNLGSAEQGEKQDAMYYQFMLHTLIVEVVYGGYQVRYTILLQNMYTILH